MILSDVNVLVYAYRDDAADHPRFRRWLDDVFTREEPFGLVDVVLSGFVRVTTHRRIFHPSTDLADALAFCNALRQQPNAVTVVPGRRHWSIFNDLCTAARATGDLVADAYLAALAIESGSELITIDRDFMRFPGLRWRHPF